MIVRGFYIFASKTILLIHYSVAYIATSGVTHNGIGGVTHTTTIGMSHTTYVKISCLAHRLGAFIRKNR